jgi:hypothetical protein
MTFSASDFACDWLNQFADGDRAAAARLADALMLVSRDVFHQELRRLADPLLAEDTADGEAASIALYAEREVAMRRVTDPSFGYSYDTALPFFPGFETGRATGPGVSPIIVDPRFQDVGSEGPIANFITNYERLHRGSVFNHPGPDQLRSKRVRRIVIITDFIGSGKRINEMLDAFWAVATIRSWVSYRLLRFTILCFSGTEPGVLRVRSHRLGDDVRLAHGCPTVDTAFRKRDDRKAIDELCNRYPPGHRSPFGFRATGALIAFAHGMPNNAPAVFHSGKGGWRALFVNRSALTAGEDFPASNVDALAKAAEEKLALALVRKQLDRPDRRQWVELMLIMTAIEGGARTSFAISAQTHIGLADVDTLLRVSEAAAWTTPDKRLTDLGREELRRLRRRRARIVELPSGEQPFYYPTQLKAR